MDRVPFLLEVEDGFQRIETQRPVRAAMMLEVALAVAFHAAGSYQCLEDGQLGHTAIRAVQLKDVGLRSCGCHQLSLMLCGGTERGQCSRRGSIPGETLGLARTALAQLRA